jgi:hypothetical protein
MVRAKNPGVLQTNVFHALRRSLRSKAGLMTKFTLDRKLYLGTDVAGFFLFHPEDLTHRSVAPLGWYSDIFSCRKEFDTGRLVAFCTKTDGGFGFRLTTEQPTPREQKYLINECDFRLRVHRGRILLDNGNSLPNDDYVDEIPDDSELWIELPNGDYRVTVSAINWSDEPGAYDEKGQVSPDALPNYLIRFTQVKDILEVPVFSMTPPDIIPVADYPVQSLEMQIEASDNHRGKQQEPVDGTELTLIEDERWLLVPGQGGSIVVSDQLWDLVNGSVGGTMKPNRQEWFVLAAPKAKVGDNASLVKAGGGSKTGREPWNMDITGFATVRITELSPSGSWKKVKFERLVRPQTDASPKVIANVKEAFLLYAFHHEQYRREVAHPDYTAEHIEALTWIEKLIRCLRLTDELRFELLMLSDADRFQRIHEYLIRELAAMNIRIS